MDLTAILGFAAAVGLILFGMAGGFAFNGSLAGFFNAPALLIVVGGAFGALIMIYPLEFFRDIPRLVKKAVSPKRFLPQKYISDLEELAGQANLNSLLSLQEGLENYGDEFLREGVLAVIDGARGEAVQSAMEAEIGFMIARHDRQASFFEKGASLAPGFGMLGALTGLINMIGATGADKGGVTAAMAAALVAAFYGFALANLVFLPVANRLRQKSSEEVLCRRIAAEGVALLAAGANPRRMREKLLPYIPPEMRRTPSAPENFLEK